MCCPFINLAKTPGLGYVDFLFVPYMNSPFANRTRADIQAFASQLGQRTYWADDDAGVMVREDEVQFTGTGKVEIIEP